MAILKGFPKSNELFPQLREVKIRCRVRKGKSQHFNTYCILLRDYHRELRDGECIEAEKIRTLMEESAQGMTWDECCVANRLSAELWEASEEEMSRLLVKYLED